MSVVVLNLSPIRMESSCVHLPLDVYSSTKPSVSMLLFLFAWYAALYVEPWNATILAILVSPPSLSIG